MSAGDSRTGCSRVRATHCSKVMHTLAGRGQALVSVPASAWVTADTVQRSSIGALVEGLEPWLQLALFLLHESGQPASPWRAYLDTLPSEGAAPLFWSDAELRELQGTQVLLSVRGYRRGPLAWCLQA